MAQSKHRTEEVMRMSWKRILWVTTIVCTFVFLGLTVDSLRRLPAQTRADQISALVVEGKRLWQGKNCNNCHTILGIGGYYAPDVTKSYAVRGEAWLRQFLKDPQAMYPGARQMPSFHLNEEQTTSLVAYLKWVSGIDTNDWPPTPKTVARAESPGARLFLAHNCNACHAIRGVGGTIGPDLAQVGSRRPSDWIRAQLEDPRSHKSDSLMPSYAQLPQVEKEQLVEYLSSLR